MSGSHRALIVEDDHESATDLEEILKACGCECTTVTNRRDALAYLQGPPPCIVLLDLEIKAEPESIRGHVEHGNSILRAARALCVERAGTAYLLPIVVISGFAHEADAAVAAMKDGASDVIQKLSKAREKAERIRRALEESGRGSHEACDSLSHVVGAAEGAGHLVLSVPGDEHGRRVLVRLGQRPAKVTYGALKVLLQLVKGRLGNRPVHKNDLGGREGQGFRGISVLLEQLAVACAGDEKALITNDQRGSYSLAARVVLGTIATEKLERLGDQKITSLAREIRRLSNGIGDADGKA
jgi:CheY-like chemotaxis protein